MAIIDGLPEITIPVDGDEMLIERGEYSFKIDYQALAEAILLNIGGDVVSVEHGGSGISVNPSMQVNLASDAADNVFKASPTPGVTGVLPLANGGTGVNSLAGLQGILSMAFGLYLTSTAWAGLYSELSVIATNTTATYKCNAPTTSLLTDSKVSTITFGVVSRLTDTIFEFMARQANTGNILVWRVTFDSTGSSATVGSVYRFTGTAI